MAGRGDRELRTRGRLAIASLSRHSEVLEIIAEGFRMPVPNTNRQIVLKRRPDPDVTAGLFEAVDVPMPAMEKGRFLVRNLYLSVDPAMRGWIAEAANYSDPVPIGGVMRSFAVGEVVASDNALYREGEIVAGWLGWQAYAVADGSEIQRKVDPALAPVSSALGVLGITGATAHVGLLDVCRPKSGETVLVTTAAGSVGAAAGQIAKIKGCRTIGLTGSDEKARICTEEFGYDAVINYRAATDLSAAIAAAAHDGIDCCFDNVGGSQLDAVLEHINVGARIAICGTIGMPSFPIPEGPRMNRTLLVKRARIEGFLVLDHFGRYGEIIAELTGWYRDGLLRDREDVADGLDAAPAALEALLLGRNLGKQIVRIGGE
jgi:NADPH-dependent curcumin reductase CurA